jgi:nucleolar complex protein 3
LHAEVPLAGEDDGSDPDADNSDPSTGDVSDEDAEFVRERGAAAVGFLRDLDARQLGAQVLSRQAAEAAAQARREDARRQRQELQQQQQTTKGKGGDGSDDDDSESSDSDAEAEYEKQPRGRPAARAGAASAAADDDDAGPALPVKAPDGRLVYLKGDEAQRRRQQLRMLGGAAGEEEEEAALAHNAPTAGPRGIIVRAADVVPLGGIPGVSVTDALDEEEAAAREEGKRRELERRLEAERKAQAEAARKRAAAVHPGLALIAAATDRMARREAARTQLALASTQALAAEASSDPPPAAALGSALRLLNALAMDADAYVARLAQLSLLAVFRDVAPGYRIRLDSNDEGGGGGGGGGEEGGGGGGKGPSSSSSTAPVSKEVQRLRDYESALIKGYQAYLKTLLAAADRGEHRVQLPPPSPKRSRLGRAGGNTDNDDDDDDGEAEEAEAAAQAAARAAAQAVEIESRRAGARVAVRCMARLLTSLPHFNYSSDLLRALVARMASRDADARAAAVAAVGATARQYAAGGATSRLALEAVQLVADLVRRRRCVCPPETVACLLDVRLEAAAAAAAAMRGDDARDLSAAEINRRKQRGRMASNAARKQALRDKRKGVKPGGGAGGADDDGGGRGGQRSAALQRAVREAGDAAVKGLGRDMAEGDVHDARGAAEAAKVQSRMVEAMFEIFFRVLKHCTAALKASAATAAAAAEERAIENAAAGGDDDAAGGKTKNKKKKGNINGWAEDDDAARLMAAREDQQAEWPAARVARKFPLLAPSLQGIARHSHLLSLEYLPDLAAVLQSLLEPPSALPLRERLHALDCAARALLRGQGEALLAVDRRGLLRALYAALLDVPRHPLHDADFFVASLGGGGGGCGGGGAKGGAGGGGDAPALPADERADAEADAREAVAARMHAAGGGGVGVTGVAAKADGTTTALSTGPPPLPTPVLLVRVCEAFLLEGSRTAVDAPTLAAFAKRLCTVASACASPAESVALCSVVVRLVRRHPRLSALLEWGEDSGAVPVGGKPFDACCREPADAGALGACLWELPAMAARHWHPHVAGAARQALAALAPGAAVSGASAAGPMVAAMGPQELAACYDVLRTGRFRPAPPAPPRRRQQDRQQPLQSSSSRGQQQQDERRRRQALAGVSGLGLGAELSAALGRRGGLEEEEDDDDESAGAAAAAAAAAADGVARHVAAAQRRARNASLRRERRALERRLEAFRGHLIERKRRRDEQGEDQEGKKEKKKKDKGSGGGGGRGGRNK